ncbi:MAG TPA: acyltransferase [Nitrospirae bacterium]|nr:(R)-stereoselective amidase [bacterium BMS3Abin10]GBE39777.1 (R)-stereoselective amidase [bacterium BMS3Bbin08]HDH49889.1 acyltransferase [Nitrospirota bacterium]HDK81454.1 acyltransferase [Nitrospirota bacterium]HDO26385.1 acyltransferase [Nitrospirota bacterium]
MKAGFYQFAPSFGRKKENLDKVLSAVNDVDLDLLVLPEFFATGYQFISVEEVAELSEPVPKGYTTDFLSALSSEKGIYIAAGLAEAMGDRFYNSAVLMGPGGLVGVYRKTHLFSEEKLYFTPGDTGFRAWDTDIGCIGLMICFDWFFPESMRSLALLGADIVAHPSNLVLPYCPQAMPVRCLENRVYAVTANRTGTEDRKEHGEPLTFIGQSLIVSPEGKVLTRAREDEEVLSVVELEPEKARNKSLNMFNDIFKDRRPGSYGPLSKKTKK